MITDLEYREYVLKAKNKSFMPALDWCKNNCTLAQASELWYHYGEETVSSYLECYKKSPNPKSWSTFLSPEELEFKKQNKKQKNIAARVRGGLGAQSPELKAKLLYPLTFEHQSGISITIFNCLSALEIATELNKTNASIVESTNLGKVIKGLKNTTKGWKLIKCHTKNFI